MSPKSHILHDEAVDVVLFLQSLGQRLAATMTCFGVDADEQKVKQQHRARNALLLGDAGHLHDVAQPELTAYGHIFCPRPSFSHKNLLSSQILSNFAFITVSVNSLCLSYF